MALTLGIVLLGLLVPILALWFDTPAEPTDMTSPRGVLRLDRSATLIYALVVSVPIGLLAMFASEFVILPTVGLLVGMLMAETRASMRYLAALSHFASRRELPWRLMRFMDDAHRRGVLRRVGGAYQFRHVLVQRRLAATR